jgi:hypothetical protein
MHFEVLVEDLSGKTALECLIPMIVGNEHTIRIHAYKGIGRIPKNLTLQATHSASKRILLEQLPKILRGYGRAYRNFDAAIIIVCDLDDKDFSNFKTQLLDILEACDPRPKAHFCIAIEEGEAWLLGDIAAIKKAYPKAKDDVLNRYINDSICGTWELLADAITNDSSSGLKKKGYSQIGLEKNNWAKNIPPLMTIENNQSPSFCYFRDTMKKVLE